ASETVRFENVVEPPLLSINRGFSAPVILNVSRRDGELEQLARSDSDSFARFEAMQELMMQALTAGARGEAPDTEPVVRAVAAILQSDALDAAFKAEMISIPSESLVADRLTLVDPDAVHAAREALRASIGSEVGRE